MLAWHGFTGTAEQIAADDSAGNHGQFFGLEPLAQGSAIFVAGQGLDTTLLGQTAPGWDDAGRDIAFVRALLDWLRDSYCVDDAHIFSVGVSMGGYFSNQIGCEMSDRFRAVALGRAPTTARARLRPSHRPPASPTRAATRASRSIGVRSKAGTSSLTSLPKPSGASSRSSDEPHRSSITSTRTLSESATLAACSCVRERSGCSCP